MLNWDKSHTAILVFIRSASIEALHKPLSMSKREAPKLAELMNERVITQARQSGLPTFIVDEQLQKGADFGSRLRSAFQYVFDQGFERVIAIGNDCFELSSKVLLEAQEHLVHQQVVIGPSYDGGMYLMGLNFQFFQQLDFQRIAWQCPSLFEEVCKIVQQKAYSIYLLPLANDIDTIPDLYKAFRKVKKWCRLLVLIWRLLCRSVITEAPSQLVIDHHFDRQLLLRGPPKSSLN